MGHNSGSTTGIYITMNGRIFPWDKVRKDRQAGEFKRTAKRLPQRNLNMYADLV